MGMSEFYGEADQAAATRTIARAIDLGVTLFDTADIYGLGANEELLGRALGRQRDRVVLATKFGQVRDAQGSFIGLDGSAAYVRRACEASLERLGTEVIDLYQLHRVDPATPIEETVSAMQELLEAGKIRHIGLSEVSAEQLRRAAGVAPISSVQSEYSLMERSVESEVLPACEELNVGFVAFAPLMRGLIARRFTGADQLDPGDTRRQGRYPRLSGMSLDQNLALARTVWEIGDRHGVPPSAVALAWLIRRGVVPIPGARTVEHLEQNLGALSLELLPDDVESLEAVVGEGGAAHGQRLPSRPGPRT